MRYDSDKLNLIYDKTDGCCHLCHKKLSFYSYGKNDAKGGWHVDHSKPKAKGGSDHLNNLYPACIPCNLKKNSSHNNTVRPLYGTTRAPYSKTKKEKIHQENVLSGATLGGIIGMVGGPAGAFIGAVVGGLIGSESSPKR